MTCKNIAERLAEGALANYGRDGELVPAIIILDREEHAVVQAIPVLAPELHGMAGALYTIGSMLCPLYEGRFIVAISETWTTSVVDAPKGGLRRGELEERALSGDTTVETSLLVAVYDLQDLPDSHTLLYNVDRSFQRTDVEGVSNGEIAGAVRKLAEVVAHVETPPGPVPVEIAQLAVEVLAKYVHAVMVPGDE